ncbi:c-type cytochrome [Thalassotalea agarivorans]|uniref:Cytochrome c553 n=1 Tax=Thalassotalea agarivorans TaxID=349064 RepID=A0A1I0FVC0_THASX|nr:c-type cytochrome [Thalassotalea agarivorans]SET62221.1 Cytochrome c553 [Thalassotalea agarivorans]
MNISKNILITISLVTLFTVLDSKANEEAKALYQQCVACHGENGQGVEALKSPQIAGQEDWYIERQLLAFANGHRGADAKDSYGAQMVAIAKTLTKEQVKTLSAYVVSMPATDIVESLEGDLKKGYSAYQAKCGVCHGAAAEGNKVLNAPRLNNLTNEYLVRQMQNFSTGVRGVHKDDKYGRQMAMMSRTVSEQETKDILAFIGSQK